jgi:hypothetical protein
MPPFARTAATLVDSEESRAAIGSRPSENDDRWFSP